MRRSSKSALRSVRFLLTNHVPRTSRLMNTRDFDRLKSQQTKDIACSNSYVYNFDTTDVSLVKELNVAYLGYHTKVDRHDVFFLIERSGLILLLCLLARLSSMGHLMPIFDSCENVWLWYFVLSTLYGNLHFLIPFECYDNQLIRLLPSQLGL